MKLGLAITVLVARNNKCLMSLHTIKLAVQQTVIFPSPLKISGCEQATALMRSTGLLQVVLSDLSRLVIHKLVASCYNNLHQVCKYQVAASLIFTDLRQLDEVNRLAATR